MHAYAPDSHAHRGAHRRPRSRIRHPTAGESPIVGYLLAGTLVGPYTPGFVADATLAEQLAEIGVILLMFGVGLQFHVEELLAVRRVAIPGAIAQSLVATFLGALLGYAFGWGWYAGIVFGMAFVRRQHGGARAGPRRQQRPAHAVGAYRRRLVGGRGPLHRCRPGAPAGLFRSRPTPTFPSGGPWERRPSR